MTLTPGTACIYISHHSDFTLCDPTRSQLLHYIHYLLSSFKYCVRTQVIKSRRTRWAGRVGRMGERRDVHRVLVWKPEGKRPLGRPRRKWESNVQMDNQ